MKPGNPPRDEILRLLATGHADALIDRLATLEPPLVELAPNARIPGRLSACHELALEGEALAGNMSDVAEIERVLQAVELPLRQVTAEVPFWPAAHETLGRNLWLQGHHEEALQAFGRGERAGKELAQLAGWKSDIVAVLPQSCTTVLGCMGHLDGFVKRKILTGDPRQYVLLAPKGAVVNRTLLEYWAQHVLVVTDPNEIAEMAQVEPALGVNWNWALPAPNGGGVEYVHRGIARIQRRWHDEKRPPLLRLKPEHAAALAAQKRAWGMAETDWFICLHVRSAGFYNEQPGTGDSFRNTPIEDYVPMIRDGVAAGGWVVRMGDPSMPPLDLADAAFKGRVIDYARLPERSPVLDVALCASCRVFVAAPSGLSTIAKAFGRPACLVNFPIYAGLPWHPDDVFIPRRYYARDKGRVLSFEEILLSDLVYADHGFLQEKAGVELLRNTPDEIVEAVREALDPAQYRTHDIIDRGQAVRDEFERLNKIYDTQVAARLGLHFAEKHADELSSNVRVREFDKDGPSRKLDVVIPSYNRPARLHHLLKTGLDLAIPGMYFVVVDDGSTLVEDVPGGGSATTEQVCASFGTERIVYIRNPENVGVAVSWERYYRDVCRAKYTMSVTDKDEFLNSAPIVRALRKLEADPALSMVVLPLRQKDRETDDRLIAPNYSRLTGREYLAHYVADTALQHCSMWGIIRVDAIRAAGAPRTMNLRQFGLDDGFGIDIDLVFMVAATGDVGFESEPHVRRSTLAGGTEKSPLTFAYTYYQYAKRAMLELEARGLITCETLRIYLAWWHLLILRGLVVAHRPVHGTETETGTERIQPHLRAPILDYLAQEEEQLGLIRSREAQELAALAAQLIEARGAFQLAPRTASVPAV